MNLYENQRRNQVLRKGKHFLRKLSISSIFLSAYVFTFSDDVSWGSDIVCEEMVTTPPKSKCPTPPSPVICISSEDEDTEDEDTKVNAYHQYVFGFFNIYLFCIYIYIWFFRKEILTYLIISRSLQNKI